MKRILIIAGIVVVAVAVATPFARVGGGSSAEAHRPSARGVFSNPAGDPDPVGVAKLTEEDGSVLVRVAVHGLAPGFHGFHVHAAGVCEAPFTTAGGHFNPNAASHPNHAADMPVLLVNADGTGEARFKTDRFDIADLFDADGSALIIHGGPDNYANVPARYGTPDATTLATGDAGARVACAVLKGD